MDFDQTTRKQLALAGGIVAGLFAFLAIYQVGNFIAVDKLMAYLTALVTSFGVIFIGTRVFSRILEIAE
jgi:hypothetical protein